MEDLDTGYLGPRPEPLRFPTEVAESALAAIEELSEEWQACISTHVHTAEPARIDFEGRVRNEFDEEFALAMTQIRQIKSVLDDDNDALKHLIQQASTAIEARNQEITDWDERQWTQNTYEETVRQQ